MTTPTLSREVERARSRFPALRGPTVFLDAPGGTQVPNTVIEAVAAYLREDNANTEGFFPTSARTDAVIGRAREAAASFLGCSPDEVGFGPNMTSLNFHLSRTVGRDLVPGDEVVVTRLDHDANIAPWLELAGDRGLVVRWWDIREDTALDPSDLEPLLSERTRIVAFPWASNAMGTLTDVSRIAGLAHAAGALAWVDAVHFAPHGSIDVRAAGADVLLCSAYKFFGPHLGMFFGRHDVLERWRAYKVRPAANRPIGRRFETGTLPHESLAGLTAAIEYIQSVGWDAISSHERALGERFLAGLPEGYRLHGLPTMQGRVPTFALTLPGASPDQAAAFLAERGFAVWSGHYYAVEVMRRLGLPGGALRIGFVHYNTFEEVDLLLAELIRLLASR